MTIEVDGKNIRIREWTPIEDVKRKLRSLSRFKPISAKDLTVFTQYYQDVVQEKDAQYTALMWEIFKNIRPRETSFVAEVATRRYISVGRPDYMKRELTIQMSIEGGSPFHFFASNALVKHAEDGQRKDLDKERDIWGFDYFCDIDAQEGEWMKAKQQAQDIADLFTKEGKKFSVVFSGSKGFHVRRPYQELLDSKEIKKKDKYTNEDMKKLHQKLNKHLTTKLKVQPDVIVGGGEMQLQRVPYSIHPASNLICLPLTRKEFESFTPEMASIENVLKMRIRDRGVPLW